MCREGVSVVCFVGGGIDWIESIACAVFRSIAGTRQLLREASRQKRDVGGGDKGEMAAVGRAIDAAVHGGQRWV
jgi:hypothetical protein